MALAIFIIFAITTTLMFLSCFYFEVAFDMVNRFFPQGFVQDGPVKIPNQNFATYLYPKFLYYGGHISPWIQFILAVPVFIQFGSVAALLTLVFTLFGWKIIEVLLWQANSVKSLTVEIMYVTLERRILKKQFKVEKGTAPEGERFFETFYKEIIAFIDTAGKKK